MPIKTSEEEKKRKQKNHSPKHKPSLKQKPKPMPETKTQPETQIRNTNKPETQAQLETQSRNTSTARNTKPKCRKQRREAEMGQVGGDGFVVAGLVQIGDGSLRKKEGSVGLQRKKEEMERQ